MPQLTLVVSTSDKSQGTNLFGPLGHKMGRWKASLVGLAVIGIALILVSVNCNHMRSSYNEFYYFAAGQSGDSLNLAVMIPPSQPP